ncbi:glycosyl transferase [Rhodosalinus halophilus]|uniref:Glycosyl transferase n=2 Tax=Rhodosalinus halophilus TaxID=2259333 RepID=A0A365UCR5_9RHOB|nr:glycosyl transferase [Rhodosalinus halophilus]
MGAQDLLRVLGLQAEMRAPLGRICVAEGLITEAQLRRALALQFGVPAIDLGQDPPDPALTGALDPVYCLTHGLLPWRVEDGTTVIATSAPERFDDRLAELPEHLAPVRMAVASAADVQAAVARLHGPALARRAEQRVPDAESCRHWSQPTPERRAVTLAILLSALGCLLLVPGLFFGALFLWAALTLALATGMKAVAFAARIAAPRRPGPTPPKLPDRPPVISILVPLLDEGEILPALIARLRRLDYPRASLDVVLILEEKDRKTRAALAQLTLPPWIRVVEVPDGVPRTKPRAMNYALDFCRGEIVGIYDAEDAPEPDQLIRVAARFAEAPPDVACLQGVLDYYNPHSTWIARCFTIEYASWFRVVLPGLARLGLVIPLGGTTLFFRRDALERLGGWDAHNVTEDCDLGIRLARHGYRTEMIDIVTQEEANNRLLPWIRQRSRWLKGFMLTYAVHMRRPRALFRQLGPRKFWGVQLLLLTATTQFLLAPLLWSFWAVPLGIPHPLEGPLGRDTLIWAGTAFLLTEALAVAIAVVAVRSTAHRGLVPWVPTMHLYFPIGALASYKAAYELVSAPFYWDKTAHGHSLDAERAPRGAEARGLRGEDK